MMNCFYVYQTRAAARIFIYLFNTRTPQVLFIYLYAQIKV